MDKSLIINNLLIKYPLFGSIIANSNFVSNSSISTAGTDGKNIYYNPDFVNNLTDDEKTFAFAHEICHIAFDHIFRSKGKNKELWNIATDSVINAFLKQDGLPMVEDAVDIPEAINYDAEEMYNKLLKEKNEKQSNNSSDSQNNNSNDQEQPNDNANSNSENKPNNKESSENSKNNESYDNQNNKDAGHDSHSMWEDAIKEKHTQEKEKQNKDSSSDTNQNDKNISDSQNNDSNNQKKANKNTNSNNENKTDSEKTSSNSKNNESQNNQYNQNNFETNEETNNKVKSNNNQNKDNISIKEKKIKELIDKMVKIGENKSFKQNRIERKKQLEELRNSLANKSHTHGNDTNSNAINLNNVGVSESLLDWRRILRETIKYDIDWSYQNAGIEDGVVTAYLEEFPKPETEIILDTSGSINQILLKNFLRECKNIMQNSKVKVGCFDTEFYGFVEIKKLSDIDNIKLYGGGGTDFEVAVTSFTKRVENKIIFTDGDAPMPETPLNVIWIVFGYKKINPPGGKVIYIDKNSLNKLSNFKLILKKKEGENNE